jgi:hypothetical protein
MNTVETLRHLAAIADSRAEVAPIGSEDRSDYQWFSGNANSLANAIEDGRITAERQVTEIARLNTICDLSV